MPALVAGLLVFFTSAAVLVIEILAARLLAPFVGETLQTYTAIIGTILAGIAMGSWLGGKVADRVDPRVTLGPTIMAGGALALATVPIVTLFGQGLGAGVSRGGPGTTIVLAFIGFFLPATVLTAVTPMVIKVRLSSLDETGRVVGRLSALGTAGAIAGTFVTGFLLVAAFPTRPIFLGVGGILLFSGLVVHLSLGVRREQPIAGILILGLLGTGATSLITSPCEIESAYYCAQVIDGLEPCDGRTLYLDTLRHSCVHPDDPMRLDFSYTQILSDVLASVAPGDSAIDVLHIGGGGFTMPRHVEAARPGSTNLVLELDPALVEIAEDELGLETGPGLRVDVGDARTALSQQPDDTYDVVIGDAFGGLAVPWHLTTREVTEQVQRTLRPDGLYAINLIDNPPLGFARAEAATLREVFADVAVIAPRDRLAGLDGGNFILVGSDTAVPVEAITASNAERGDDDQIITGAEVDAFTEGARVLTDDYAPVDQLLTPY
ncbi:MAG: spermidine synthase [Nitriliruptorales bacterium]|nr:spermidine synthase [Nitriliruptorales bacterium]